MIKIDGINKYYKKKQVLFDFTINLNIDKGSIYGLIGPNGAGKTTLIKIITELLDFTSGTISTTDSNNYKAWCQENITLIPAGERGIRFKNTVMDNAIFFAAMKGISSSNILEKADDGAF